MVLSRMPAYPKFDPAYHHDLLVVMERQAMSAGQSTLAYLLGMAAAEASELAVAGRVKSTRAAASCAGPIASSARGPIRSSRR